MERDDLIVNESYALNAKHSEEAGKQIRKKLYAVTILLTVITLVEVFMGVAFKRNGTFAWEAIKLTFLVLTLVKAAYIVLIFMHLGDEVKWFRFCVLIPLTLFIWFIIAFIYDGSEWKVFNENNPARFDYHQTK
jgi:caa(3)-type oxidase subunit IV